MSMMGRSLFCCDEAHIGTIGIKEIAPMARLLLAALALFFASPALAETITGQATVIDGDTLEIQGQRIRLSGIDAPESSQLCRGDDSLQYRCGAKAANELAEHVAGRPVSCEGVGRDQYGRAVAVCSIDGEDVAFWVVRNGLAFDWPRYSKGRYVGAQKEAERAAHGVWAGSYVVPWAYRACIRNGGRLAGVQDADFQHLWSPPANSITIHPHDGRRIPHAS
jgi:endonuclease YncB( thermonuclease family)